MVLGYGHPAMRGGRIGGPLARSGDGLFTLGSLLLACRPPLDGTVEEQVLPSLATGDQYLVRTLTPSTPRPDGGWPVAVVLDGDWSFDLVARLAESLADEGAVPPLLVVAVGYADGNHRAQDYTPTAVSDLEGSGGGPAFLDFVEQELLPWEIAERGGSVDPTDRVLLGWSLGGLCGVVALFDDRPFGGFVVSSPSLWYDDGVAFESEATWTPGPDTRVFASMGAWEDSTFMNAPFAAFVDRMEARTDVDFASQLVPSGGHSRSVPSAYEAGLRHVFHAENP